MTEQTRTAAPTDENLVPLTLDAEAQQAVRRAVRYLETANCLLRDEVDLDEDDFQDAGEVVAQARAALGMPPADADEVSSDPGDDVDPSA